VTKRGQKIEALEFGSPDGGEDEPRQPAAAGKRVADSKTGQLRLRVVEGDD
jgi:DNA recombination protein RmuC